MKATDYRPTSNSVSNTGSSKSCSTYGSSSCTTRHRRLPFGPFDCMLYCQKYVFSLWLPDEMSAKISLSSLEQPATQIHKRKRYIWKQYSTTQILNMSCPARVVWWLEHMGTMCSRARCTQCAVGSRFNSSCGPVRCVRLRKSKR